MGKKKKNNYKNPNQVQNERGNKWFIHYHQYLCSLAFQLFEWENLPDSVDPRFLEMTLHMFGYVGFYKDKKLGYIACQGAVGGEINHYLLPTTFHANAPNYQKTFEIFNYSDIKNAVIYCDPPYRNTTKYSNGIDYEEFYQWCKNMAKNNRVQGFEGSQGRGKTSLMLYMASILKKPVYSNIPFKIRGDFTYVLGTDIINLKTAVKEKALLLFDEISLYYNNLLFGQSKDDKYNVYLLILRK